MKKKILLICLMVSLFVVVFALSTSAATTNEFSSTVETIDGINLEGMNSDTTSRIVLYDGKEYHTYPAQYIVTEATTITFNFNKINNALSAQGKNISYNRHSVIRIEVPANITNSGECSWLSENDNLVEIFFPKNSQLKTIPRGSFYSNEKLEKINIPASVTEITGNQHFNGDIALKYVTFDDGCQITTLPDRMFQNCASLETLVIPNSVTTIEAFCFTGTKKLTSLTLSANLINFGGKNFPWIQYKDEIFKIYAPDTFLANNEKITAPVYDKEGTFTTYPSSMYSVCIYFCGDKDDIDALIAKSEYDKFTNANLVEWDPSKSDDEYGALNTWTVVYNYSECKAFYDNEHLEDTNPCLIECTRCDMAEVDPNGQHSFTDKITYADYYSNGTLARTCATENCPYHTNPLVDNSIAPLFTYLGFSSNGIDITVGYTVNLDAYNAFVEHGNALASFGVVGYIPSVENANPLNASESGVELVEPEYTIHASIPTIHSGFDFIIRGVNATDSISLVMCAYIYDGSKIIYLGNGTQSENATTITVSNGQLVA